MSCTKSSLEAAAEAAARVNAMLIAKGKLKLPPTNNKVKNQCSLKVTGDLFTAEVEINDAPLSARNMLTRGITQDEINKYSGAAISTRGRYMTFEDRAKNANERPLYLHIQASTKEAVELAIDKIHKIIDQHLKSTGSTLKWPKTVSTIRSSSASLSPPPLMSINTNTISTGQTYVQEKIFVGLEHVSPQFQPKEKVVGPGESYLQHIRTETGANVTLRGKGSGYLEPASGREAFEPLHIYLTHPNQKGLQAAKELALNLIQTVQQEYAQWQQQQTLAVLTMQSPQNALGAQQVAFQQSLQVGMVPTGTLGIGMAHDPVAAMGVAQNSLQNPQLQVGGLSSGNVATSMSALLPSSLSSSLSTSLPNILTSTAGGQLQLVQGQVLTQAGGFPTLVTHTQPIQTVVTTANMNVLPQASQVVYTPTFQQQPVQTSQTMVHATPAILTSQAQLVAASQQQHLSQMTLQTHPQTAPQHPQSGTAPTTFYFVSQSPLTSTGFGLANNPSAVQIQVDAQAAQVQALAQVQAQAQAQVQQQQQQQQRQQTQSQARILQVSSASPNGPPLLSVYPFQVTNVTTATHTTPTSVTYPQYRAHSDMLSGQKRKFQEESQMRDSYMYGTSLRSSGQQGLVAMPSSTSANHSHSQQHQHHHAMTMSVAASTPGLQANPGTGLIMPQQLMSSKLVPSKSNDLNYREQQMMPPPPVPISQGGGNNLRTNEMERKRLKGSLWNVQDDDPNTPMSPVGRQLQRCVTASRQRNYPYGGGKSNMYPMRNDEELMAPQSANLQGQVGYSQSSTLRYQYQSPFWMAPN